MTENGKETLDRLKVIVSQLSEPSKNYFIGFGDGLVYKKENEESKTA